ncbi:MAG: hypothetical protein U0R19_40940 [Bryobacteraceae bacterium]
MLLSFALSMILAFSITAQSTEKSKAAPKKKASNSGSLEKPKDEFGKAGKSGKNYENAGKAAGKAGKNLGTKTADGNIAGGASDFGKGMGTMGKEVGVGTAKVGSSVGRGVASVFSGGGKDKPKTKSKSAPKK